MKIKHLICAALLGGALLFSGAVEAGIVTDRLPLTCYCDHRVYTYNNAGGGQVGYIDANVDLIQVTNIRSDGWAYGSYPGRGGRVSRWFKMSELCADVNYSNRSANVNGAQRVFRTRSSNDTIGSVSNNESVIVIADNGNRAQIVYRLDNGTGYKMGWVPSSAVAARGNQNFQTNNPIVQPVSRYATLNDGWYKISPLHAPNRLLDVSGASTAVGANIQLWDNASNVSQPNQVFYLRNLGNNWFTLKAGNCDLYVSAANVSGEWRTNIQLASPNSNSKAQRWRLVYTGTSGAYYIESGIREKLGFDCADTGSANGTNIWLWDYGDVNWNKWRFTPANPPTVTNNVSSKLQELINTWNNKTWRDHYYSPNGIQCKEFAAFIYHELYGYSYSDVGSTGDQKYTLNSNKMVCRASQSSLNSGNVKALFQNAQPGDFIQMRRGHGGAHSAILVEKTNNGVTFFEANADDKNTIWRKTYSYDDLVSQKYSKSHGYYQYNVAMSVYHAR